MTDRRVDVAPAALESPQATLIRALLTRMREQLHTAREQEHSYQQELARLQQQREAVLAAWTQLQQEAPDRLTMDATALPPVHFLCVDGNLSCENGRLLSDVLVSGWIYGALQLIKQHPGLLEVGRVKPLGEPTIDRGQ
jgi:hypothetical protein